MGDVGLMLLVGGHPAIDFVNTLGGRPDTPDDEYLHGYTDLLIWCRLAGLIEETQAQRLTAAVADHPNEAVATLRAVLQLRAAVDAVLRARLAQRAPRGEDVETCVVPTRLLSIMLNYSWTTPVADGLGPLPMQPIFERLQE
jgi:hypothetical protein